MSTAEIYGPSPLEGASKAGTSLCFYDFEGLQVRFQNGCTSPDLLGVAGFSSLLERRAGFRQLGKAIRGPATFHPVSVHPDKIIIQPLDPILQRLQTLAAVVQVCRDRLVGEAVRWMYQDSSVAFGVAISLSISGDLFVRHARFL